MHYNIRESIDNDKYNKIAHYLEAYNFEMDDIKIMELLDMLPDGYDDIFFNYLTITTILKCHNKFNIWNMWSKKNKSKYNYFKNIKLWNWSKPIYSINLLVYILRTKYSKDIEYIQFYKRYDPLTKGTFYNQMKEVDKTYVSEFWDYEDFKHFDIHIIQSTTGTGKTTATAPHIKRYMEDNKSIKFITLSTITSLIDQHLLSFKNIKIHSYKKHRI